MKTTIKKITSIFFILLGLAPFLFACLLFIKQQSIRHRMEHRLEEQFLHSVTLAEPDIQWIKKDKEILIGGKLFDIKYTEQSNGLTTFHGLYDEEETTLNNLFRDAWKKNMAGQHQLLARFFQTLQQIYYNHPNEVFRSTVKFRHFVGFTSPRLINPFKQILTPPPQA